MRNYFAIYIFYRIDLIYLKKILQGIFYRMA